MRLFSLYVLNNDLAGCDVQQNASSPSSSTTQKQITMRNPEEEEEKKIVSLVVDLEKNYKHLASMLLLLSAPFLLVG